MVLLGWPLLDNWVCDGITHSRREDHTASIWWPSLVAQVPFQHFAFIPRAAFIRVQAGHDLSLPLASAAAPPTRVGARGPPLAWLPASPALRVPRVEAQPLKTQPCLPRRLRVDARGVPLAPCKGGSPCRAPFSAAAWRSLAVSMYVGSRSEPCRQQVAALLWQVGVRLLSTEIAMHVYVDVIKVHIYTCSEARLRPAHGSKPVPEDRGPRDDQHHPQHNVIMRNHHQPP